MKTTPRLVLIALVASVTTLTRAAELAVPFRNISFDEAIQAAGREGKLVFIDFYTTWCEPCKRLDATTFSDAAVGNLVGEKAVALKLDAEKGGKPVAERYKVSAYPTLLLLRADGTEVDRIVGFREPPAFKIEFNKLLALAQSGKSGLQSAIEQVAQQSTADASSGEPEEAQPHFDLAKKLMLAGKKEEALKELLWCWDEGKKDPEFARMTRSMQVPRELGRLARDYPPAREAMIARRDQARERALANKGGSVVVQDLIQLNRELKMDGDTIMVFDQMPEGDRRRGTISIYLFDHLVERKRYADALFAYRLETDAMLLESTKARLKETAARFGENVAASSVRSAITRTVKRIEALAGAGRVDDARALAQRLLAFDASDSTRELILQHAARAGQPDLLKTP